MTFESVFIIVLYTLASIASILTLLFFIAIFFISMFKTIEDMQKRKLKKAKYNNNIQE